LLHTLVADVAKVYFKNYFLGDWGNTSRGSLLHPNSESTISHGEVENISLYTIINSKNYGPEILFVGSLVVG